MILILRHCIFPDPCKDFDCTQKPYSTCKVVDNKAVCACPEKCPDKKDLVCGSDDVTYDNECKMKQASCKSGKNITVARKDKCGNDETMFVAFLQNRCS